MKIQTQLYKIDMILTQYEKVAKSPISPYTPYKPKKRKTPGIIGLNWNFGDFIFVHENII